MENQSNNKSNKMTVKKQINNDLESFATRFSLSTVLKANQHFNVKRVIYRSTTLFISALGRFYHIHASSCLATVVELRAKKLIDDFTKRKLMHATALTV